MKYFYNILLILILILSRSFLLAQSKQLTFNVVKPKENIVIEPNYEFLLLKTNNPIKIIVEDSSRIYKVLLDGGTAQETDSNNYLLKPERIENVVLRVFDVTNNIDREVYSLKYNVAPEPKLFLNNKIFKEEVVLNLDTNYFIDQLRVKTKFNNEIIEFKVLGFSIGTTSKGDYKECRQKGGELNAYSKKLIMENPKGTYYFENIEIELIQSFKTKLNNYGIIKNKVKTLN